MKKSVLVFLALLISSCAPNVVVVEVTRVVEATAIPATATDLPTQTPSATSRPSAFSVSFEDVQNFVEDKEFEHVNPMSCLFDETPIWAKCETYAYQYRDELSQTIQIIHEDDVVLGFIIAFSNDLPVKYPDELTIAVGIIDTIAQLHAPFELQDGPLRDGDFYYLSQKSVDNTFYVWFDYRLASEMFD